MVVGCHVNYKRRREKITFDTLMQTLSEEFDKVPDHRRANASYGLADVLRYRGKLSAVREAEQCGWLKDKYGVSWQIVPTALDEMMSRGTREQIDRVTQAFLPMKKFDVARSKETYEGK